MKWIRELVTGTAAGSADVENRDWPHISSSHAEFRGSIALEATSEHSRLYVPVRVAPLGQDSLTGVSQEESRLLDGRAVVASYREAPPLGEAEELAGQIVRLQLP